MIELLPAKATYAPGEPIAVEVRGARAGPLTVSLWHLDEQVAEASLPEAETVARFPAQAEGGYGVEADVARTALDVLAEPLSRPRYGFVSNYAPGRDTARVAENVRRLHLNAIQFYDWMYRHARLLPLQDEFADPLGRTLSLDTVRRLVAACRSAGSLPIGYAAVYADRVAHQFRIGQTQSKVTVNEPAALPSGAYKPNPKLYIGLGTLLSLFLAIGVVLVRERLDKTIRIAPEEDTVLGHPVVGRWRPGPARCQIPAAGSGTPA